MLENKEQKINLIIIGVLIVSLIGVSLWNRTSFRYTDKKVYDQNNQDIETAQKYLAYLDTLQIDKNASKKLFETIITDKEIREEVENTLQTSQKINLPEVDMSLVKKTSISNKDTVENYLSQSVSKAMDFSSKTLQAQEALFSSDQDSLDLVRQQFKNLKNEVAGLSVPADAVGLHESLILALTGYERLLDAAGQYDASDYDNNDKIWPKVYFDYSVINSAAKIYEQELSSLTGKYKIAAIGLPINTAEKHAPEKNILGIKTAHAFLGIGDVTITVGDIPRIIMDAVKEGLRSAFAQFMGSMLSKTISKIESNYLIANFLYYSDALVAGQYADDYLNKYVALNSDRQIIKRFIPQFSCGANTADLKPVFEAKAKSYLGFTPDSVKPSDPDYYLKMAKVGDFMASPEGWRTYFEDMAQLAKSEAEKTAEKELTSPGLKTARDISKNGLAKSLNNIVSAQRASFTALLQLGAQNAEGIISGFVAQLTQTLVNNFVFKGVTGGNGANGGVAVLKEQSTCVAVAQLQPILALDETQYQQPAAPPTTEQVYCQQNPTDANCRNIR